MYFHGGGWILGGFDTHDRLVRELATLCDFICISTIKMQAYKLASNQIVSE
jgi:acetyl esterase/lipase